MATIRELRARFTADAQGLKGIFRDMQTGFRDMSRSSNQSVTNINRDFSSMQSAISDVEQDLRDVGQDSGFDELNTAIRRSQDVLSETGSIGEAQMDEIRTAITRARENFDDLGDDGRDSLRRLERSVNQLDTEIRDLGRDSGMDELRSDVGDLNQELGETAENAEEAADATARIGASANVAGIGSIFASLGKVKLTTVALVGSLAAVGVGLVKMVQQGDELKKSFNTLQTQTGATNEEMEGMEDSLLNIYKNNFGESFDDIARSMANVKQVTGLTDDALEEMTTTALLMRDSFGYEVEESVKAADTMMKNFGITAEEAYTLIAQGAQQGADKGGKLQFAA